MLQITACPHFMKLHFLQNTQHVSWSVTHCCALLNLQVLELKATQTKSGACYSGVMFRLLWCLPQAKGYHTTPCRQLFIMQRSLVELVGIFLCPIMKVLLIDIPKRWKWALSVIRRQGINSSWAKISRDHLYKHLQLCLRQLPNYWTAIIVKKYVFFLSVLLVESVCLVTWNTWFAHSWLLPLGASHKQHIHESH
jgi:hypothetical protein